MTQRRASFSARTQLVALAIVALSGAACGPVQSTSLIIDADVELGAARTADASRLAPYEYTAAELYLHKAREEQGYADYEQAIDFAQKAANFAKDAKQKAMAAKREGALPTDPVAPPPAAQIAR
ncbi:MAG: DUF4398 domain-containing protein [Myxococcales bacterium]